MEQSLLIGGIVLILASLALLFLSNSKAIAKFGSLLIIPGIIMTVLAFYIKPPTKPPA